MITERIRNAWLNRCLLCLVFPYHGQSGQLLGAEHHEDEDGA